MVIDLGRLNRMCRHGVVAFEWSQQDNHHFDLYGHIPRRVSGFHRRTPVVRIDFMNTEIMSKDEGFSHNGLHRFTEAIARNAPPCLVIGDLLSHSCIRLKHNRVVFPSEKVPKDHPYVRSARDKYFRPWITGQLLDQYQIDEDEVLNEIGKFLSGAQQITMRDGSTIVESSRYTCLLENALQEGVVDVLATDEPEI